MPHGGFPALDGYNGKENVRKFLLPVHGLLLCTLLSGKQLRQVSNGNKSFLVGSVLQTHLATKVTILWNCRITNETPFDNKRKRGFS